MNQISKPELELIMRVAWTLARAYQTLTSEDRNKPILEKLLKDACIQCDFLDFNQLLQHFRETYDQQLREQTTANQETTRFSHKIRAFRTNRYL